MTPFVCPVPGCGGALAGDAGRVACANDRTHGLDGTDGVLYFAPNLDPKKYTAGYAEKYAFLWSYGYETLGWGHVEGLYRTTLSLAAQALVDGRAPRPVVVDCGCGTGRIAAELSGL